MTVESLIQARARATKPEPLSQSHRARAAEPELPSQSQSQQIHTFDVKRNSSTAVKSTDFNSELRFDKQKVIMRVEIVISNLC